jgi:hypothetical protein
MMLRWMVFGMAVSKVVLIGAPINVKLFLADSVL